jgi:hypothetical protein
MSMQSEDMAPLRLCRCMGIKKKKILLSVYEGEHQATGEHVQGLEVKTRRCRCLSNR